MEKKNLLDLDLQIFGEEVEDTGVEVQETADLAEEDDSSDEVDYFETNDEEEEEPETVEPVQQSAEENARYAAIRRRAEEDARRKYASMLEPLNQRVAAMCDGVTHPVTGQPVTNVIEYFDALENQERIQREQELQEKGVDPSYIDRAIASNPMVIQANRIIQQQQQAAADSALQTDISKVVEIDPNIKSFDDLANMPNFPEIARQVGRGLSLVDAYKMVNFENYMHQNNEAARQKAINQMRGKSHLASRPVSVATENDDVEVPAEIMKSWKADGKSEKDIRALYKTVAGKLNIS